jgi:hypothetical protein
MQRCRGADPCGRRAATRAGAAPAAGSMLERRVRRRNCGRRGRRDAARSAVGSLAAPTIRGSVPPLCPPLHDLQRDLPPGTPPPLRLLRCRPQGRLRSRWRRSNALRPRFFHPPKQHLPKRERQRDGSRSIIQAQRRCGRKARAARRSECRPRRAHSVQERGAPPQHRLLIVVVRPFPKFCCVSLLSQCCAPHHTLERGRLLCCRHRVARNLVPPGSHFETV